MQYYAIRNTTSKSPGFYRYLNESDGPAYVESSTEKAETLYFANILLSHSPSSSGSNSSLSFDQSLDRRLTSTVASDGYLNVSGRISSKPPQTSGLKDFDYALDFVHRTKVSCQYQKDSTSTLGNLQHRLKTHRNALLMILTSIVDSSRLCKITNKPV